MNKPDKLSRDDLLDWLQGVLPAAADRQVSDAIHADPSTLLVWLEREAARMKASTPQPDIWRSPAGDPDGPAARAQRDVQAWLSSC